MTDETHQTSHLPGGGAPDADLTDAVERLQALGPGRGTPRGEPPVLAPRPSRSAHAARGLRRHARVPSDERAIAHIAAPVAFLVAVIVLLSLVVESGVIGGGTPLPSPSPSASASKSAAAKPATKAYVVKSGDTLSGIAVRFDTTPEAIRSLNPGLSSTSLVVGQKLRLPPQ